MSKRKEHRDLRITNYGRENRKELKDRKEYPRSNAWNEAIRGLARGGVICLTCPNAECCMNRNYMPADDQRPVIYMVDDEPLMLDYAEMSLTDLACEVKRFTNPTEALEAFKSNASKPTLLLTDYSMSPINGLELSEQCKSADPDLKIVMLSGTINEEFARGSKVPLDAFMSKPYQPRALAETVDTVLRRGGKSVI